MDEESIPYDGSYTSRHINLPQRVEDIAKAVGDLSEQICSVKNYVDVLRQENEMLKLQLSTSHKMILELQECIKKKVIAEGDKVHILYRKTRNGYTVMTDTEFMVQGETFPTFRGLQEMVQSRVKSKYGIEMAIEYSQPQHIR